MKMARICILTLIGLPALGKTTFCDWMLNIASENFPFSTIHICYDDFLHFSVEKANDVDYYKRVRSQITTIIEHLIQSLRTTSTIPPVFANKFKISTCNAQKSFLVICDDNHFYRSMRYKIYQLCRTHQIAYAQVYFEGNEEISVQRNAMRSKEQQVPIEVLKRMSERLEFPNPKSYPWENQTLTLNSTTLNFNSDDIFSFIENSFNNIPKSLVSEVFNSDQMKEPATVIHRLDILLRRHIKDIVSLETTDMAKQDKVMILNSKRKNILKNIRNRKQLNLNDNELNELLNSLQ